MINQIKNGINYGLRQAKLKDEETRQGISSVLLFVFPCIARQPLPPPSFLNFVKKKSKHKIKFLRRDFELLARGI